MSKIVWDEIGTRRYETGVDHAVLYPFGKEGNVSKYLNGVAWNGITAINEQPSGAEASPLYADNMKYLNLMSAEEFAATIEAYTYPDEFADCDGTAEIFEGIKVGQQERKKFCLAYRTKLGDDVEGDSKGYLLHIIYNCLAAPSEKGYSTINESPEAITFSWSVSTTPVEVEGLKPTAIVTIDSTKVSAENMAKIENALYGTTSDEPHVLMPNEIVALLGNSESLS